MTVSFDVETGGSSEEMKDEAEGETVTLGSATHGSASLLDTRASALTAHCGSTTTRAADCDMPHEPVIHQSSNFVTTVHGRPHIGQNGVS